MSEWVAVRLGMHCPDCMGPVPLNRIEPTVLCHHCLSPVDVEWPATLFAQGWSAAPRTWVVGKRDFSANVSLAIKMEVERLAGAPANASARAADPLVVRKLPDARGVYNESAGGNP